MSEQEELKQLRIDNDMAGGIFQEIKELLSQYECMHKEKQHDAPPMFYTEWIQCVVNKARADGINAGLWFAQYQSDSTVRFIWNAYLKYLRDKEKGNEMERTKEDSS